MIQTPPYTRAKLGDTLLRGGSLPVQPRSEPASVSAQTNKHPIGFNVRPGVHYAHLLEQVKKMGGCRAMLFHEYPGGLHHLHAFKPYVDLLIWRPAHFISERLHQDVADPRLWVTQRKAELIAAGFTHADMPALHLHNESGWNTDMLLWETAASERAVMEDMRVVALNQAVGNPNEQQMPLVELLLRVAAQHPENVYIGVHDGYFSVTGERKYPWYLGRWQATRDELNGGHSYESYRQTLLLDGIRYVITEAGAENIADDAAYTTALPRTGGRAHVGPVHANDAAWSKLYGAAYPGKDKQYLKELQTAWTVGRWSDSRIYGVCLFSWGAGGQWADYDVSGMSVFLNELAAWRPVVSISIDPTPTVQVPDQPGALGKARVLTTRLNVRSQPGLNSHILGSLPKGSVVSAYPATQIEVDGFSWVYMDTLGLRGWLANKAGLYYEWIDPRPPVVPDTPPPIEDEDTTDITPEPPVTRAELESVLRRITRLEQTIDALRTALNVQTHFIEFKESA